MIVLAMRIIPKVLSKDGTLVKLEKIEKKKLETFWLGFWSRQSRYNRIVLAGEMPLQQDLSF